MYCWIIQNNEFNYVGEIVNMESHILEIIQDSYYLVTRSKSKYIRIWHSNSLMEASPLDNQIEVLSMTFNSCFIITCDINYEIR